MSKNKKSNNNLFGFWKSHIAQKLIYSYMNVMVENTNPSPRPSGCEQFSSVKDSLQRLSLDKEAAYLRRGPCAAERKKVKALCVRSFRSVKVWGCSKRERQNVLCVRKSEFFFVSTGFCYREIAQFRTVSRNCSWLRHSVEQKGLNTQKYLHKL